MLFSYKAKTKEGEIVQGVMESLNRFTLSRELRSRGSVPISISSQNVFSGHLKSFEKIFAKVKLKDQISFCKNMSGMLKAGLSLSRALSVLKKQTQNPEFDRVLTELSNEINSGGTLSLGLAKFPKIFSKLFISMVKAGEESGNLAGTFSEIQSNLEKSHNLNKKIKGALIYPGIILSAMVLIGILMFAFVVPTLAKTFKDLNEELPTSTKVVVALGDFFSNHLLLSFVIVIGEIPFCIALN